MGSLSKSSDAPTLLEVENNRKVEKEVQIF